MPLWFDSNENLFSAFNREDKFFEKGKFYKLIEKGELDSLEKEYIEFYDSTNINIGYNIAFGGQGGDLGPIVN